MVSVSSPTELEKFLSGCPHQWAHAVAARIALRVLPLAFTVLEVPDERLSLPQKQALTLHVFRATYIAWAASKYPVADMIPAAFAAARAVMQVTDDIADVHEYTSEGHAAALAAALAAYATVPNSAASDAADTAAAANQIGVWSEVSADCSWLEAGSDKLLIDQPLWLIDMRGDRRYKANLPLWTRKPLDAFASSHLVKGTAWTLIIDWYRAILPSRMSGAPRSLFGKEADVRLATMPETFWEVTPDRTATTVINEVAAIAGWKGRDTEFDVDQTMQSFILGILADSDRPLEIQQIVERFRDEGYSSPEHSIRGRLNELVSEEKILRVGRGRYAASSWSGDGDGTPSQADIPVPPSQGHGPHLGVEDGQIVFAPVSSSDHPGTDFARVRAFLPLVREALEAFLASTPPLPEGGNDPFQREKRMAVRYLDASSGDATSMDFDLLFGVGTSLMNRLAAETRRSLESDLAPFSDGQRLALEDFQANHGPMIVATAAGAEAVASAERMIRNPDEERKLRETVVELMEAVKAEQGLAKPEVADLLHDAAAEMGTGHQAERSFQFGQGAARNTTIVLSSVGAMTALPVFGLAAGGPIGAILAATLSYILWEATKKSKPFEKAIRPVTELLNGLSELDRKKLDHLIESGTSDRFARFTLKEEARLRAIAGNRPEFEWLHKQLDFLKANYKPKK